ncbi:hypothetical protein BDV38DRAFT_286563 [Aspergillus pseudotamarii]|uniref:Uncharacterized protein n=1 Tax=Aspergillus pseudotamarii TaxID=132259 RepID=A0A5N6SID3_ASPPS|nr:uncharacterized protein BDV38DRAFT_286563 [Aspergillus pseudotamarii]KAE8133667.1 hypothetical protein BDV38DRAFT_286563 [Aspergillus pseudotamarii]
MGWFSDDSDQAAAYDEYNNSQEHHEASLSHELLAGAIALEAAKAYEDHCEPDSHATAKELLAGITGALLDREIETRGLDWIDRERAQAEADNHLDGELQNRYN